MARRIAESTLNASTVDILNVIRTNASLEYQSLVPSITQATDIPKVGEVLMGHPALANQFINALVNRIALVRARSATFNNPYSALKKGYLEYGETIEEIFVEIAKVYEYSAEKAEGREFKRTLPDVHAAFHVINWRVIYPVTIEDDQLARAFLSADGVQDMIARIVDQIYTAAEYDEFLLFKYMIIKAVTSGKMKPVAIPSGDVENNAITFRGASNKMQFMSRDYNEFGVLNNTPRDRQQIFMSAEFDAAFDVLVLASAFNMEKAEYLGRRHLIDDFTTFDNERFAVIRANSTGLEEVTSTELALMANVVGVLVDSEWFQVYDNLNKFTEKYVASGLYWNYFFHTWKTISNSPFHNAVVFVTSSASISAPEALTFKVSSKDVSDLGMTIINLEYTGDPALASTEYKFVQTSAATAAGVAINPYGSILVPYGVSTVALVCMLNGAEYDATITVATLAAGATVTMEPPAEGGSDGGSEGGSGT